MEQRPLEYTVKIYCEGFTEWYYFEWLRTNISRHRHRYPGQEQSAIRHLSRSKGEIQKARSYFHRESPLHRDLVSLSPHGQVCTNQLRNIRGFASCHWKCPDKIREDSSLLSEEQPIPWEHIEKPNKQGKGNRLLYQACKYEPIENEIANYTEVFKAIHFFRLLQKFAEIRLLLAEKLRANVAIQPNVASHKSLAIIHNENMICTLKYSGTKLKCIFFDGQTFDVDDTKPLDLTDSIIGYIAEIIK